MLVFKYYLYFLLDTEFKIKIMQNNQRFETTMVHFQGVTKLLN